MARLGGRISEAASHASKLIAGVGRQAVEVSQDALRTLRVRSTWAADRAVEIYGQTLGEDARAILDESPITRAILGQRATFDKDPEVFAQLHNVRVRPLLAASALTASGAGLGAFDEVLSQLTRRVFDGDDLVGRWLGDHVTAFAGEAVSRSVNAHMDTVPGASYAGGGWTHRVQHGHDLHAVAEVYSQHGSAGAVQALYHIYGRDFFTPAGIPVLPVGSAEVQRYLTSEIGLGAREAADLISLNFIELLAGVLTLAGVLRLWRLARTIREDAIIRDYVCEAEDAVEKQDFLTASELIEHAAAKRPGDHTLLFSKALIYHRAGNHIEAHDAYVDAVRLMARKDPGLSLGGAVISRRGIAASAALATSDALARTEDHRSAWAERVIRIARAGITAFETTADRLADRRLFKQVGKGSLLPGRYLSAALNYYLAGQVAGASLMLPDREKLLNRLASRYDRCLAEIGERGYATDCEGDLGFMRRFAAAQLLPPSVEEPASSAV